MVFVLCGKVQQEELEAAHAAPRLGADQRRGLAHRAAQLAQRARVGRPRAVPPERAPVGVDELALAVDDVGAIDELRVYPRALTGTEVIGLSRAP